MTFDAKYVEKLAQEEVYYDSFYKVHILIRQSWKQICQTIPRCHHFIKIQNKTNQPKIKFMLFEGKK